MTTCFCKGSTKDIAKIFAIKYTKHPKMACRSVKKAGHLPPNRKRKKKKGVNNRKEGSAKYGSFYHLVIPKLPS